MLFWVIVFIDHSGVMGLCNGESLQQGEGDYQPDEVEKLGASGHQWAGVTALPRYCEGGHEGGRPFHKKNQ